MLENKIITKAQKTMEEKNQGQEIQDIKIEINKIPKKDIKLVTAESYKKQDIQISVNEPEIEDHIGNKMSMEDKKTHGLTEKKHDISREKTNEKDFFTDIPAVVAPTQLQTIEKIENEPKQIAIKNLDDITHEMVKEIKVLKEGEKSSLNIKLKPKELGDIEIKLEIKTGQVIGKIVVENSAVKGALESQLAHLKDNLNKQDILLQDIEIMIQQNTPEQHEHQEREQSFFNQGDNREKKPSRQVVEQQTMESTIDSSVYYQRSLSQPYYNSQRSSLNLLA